VYALLNRPEQNTRHPGALEIPLSAFCAENGKTYLAGPLLFGAREYFNVPCSAIIIIVIA